jgi:hypothetical protein
MQVSGGCDGAARSLSPFPSAVYRAARQSGTGRLGKGSMEGGWVRAPASRPSRLRGGWPRKRPSCSLKRPASRSRLAGAIGPRAPRAPQRLRPGRLGVCWERGPAALQKRCLAAKRKSCLRKTASHRANGPRQTNATAKATPKGAPRPLNPITPPPPRQPATPTATARHRVTIATDFFAFRDERVLFGYRLRI